MKPYYDGLTEALDDLKERGFTHDVMIQEDCIKLRGLNLSLQPEDFEIVEVHRFEGMTDPDDSSVVYAIQSRDGLKGVLVDAYGAYSDSLKTEMIARFRIAR